MPLQTEGQVAEDPEALAFYAEKARMQTAVMEAVTALRDFMNVDAFLLPVKGQPDCVIVAGSIKGIKALTRLK